MKSPQSLLSLLNSRCRVEGFDIIVKIHVKKFGTLIEIALSRGFRYDRGMQDGILKLSPIGFIKTAFPEKFGTPRQPSVVPEAKAELQILPDWNPLSSLDGLGEFSHVWLIFGFHKNSNKVFSAKVHPPRLAGEKMGVFATRSPHRPNPLGLSLVKLVGIEGDTLHFEGVDLVDGTPIYDIKPYIPSYDMAEGAHVGWPASVQHQKLKVEYTPEVLELLPQYEVKHKFASNHLRTVIEKVLTEDPRNPMDRDESRKGKPLGFFLYDLNVVFQVEDSDKGPIAKVIRVEPKENFR